MIKYQQTRESVVRRSEEAVSNVIGAILMLAITVALATFVFAMIQTSMAPDIESRSFGAGRLHGDGYDLALVGPADVPLENGFIILDIDGNVTRVPLSHFANNTADGQTWRVGEWLCLVGTQPYCYAQNGTMVSVKLVVGTEVFFELEPVNVAEGMAAAQAARGNNFNPAIPYIRTCAPCYLDFDEDRNGQPVPPGSMVTSQFKFVNITTDNNRAGGPDMGIIFDSSNPTGGDVDLGSPHADFGGPGIGPGGGSGQPYPNTMAEGNILIIAEDLVDGNGDGLVDDPDDEAQGGSVTFTFDEKVYLNSVWFIDDETGGTTMTVLDEFDNVIRVIAVPVLGDNGAGEINIDENNVKKLVINVNGSGGISRIEYSAPL